MTSDDAARVALLASALRIALNDDEQGDPDRILTVVAHGSHDEAEVHRLFATLIEASNALLFGSVEGVAA